MKKLLAILALALFIGGISVPAIAADNHTVTVITLNEEDPKKEETSTTKDSEAKAETKKAENTKKSSDCTKTEKSESNCSKKCGDKC